MDARRWWLLAAGAVLAGAALTVPFRDLWEVDEPRYAEVAREMIASGQWLVPHLYGEPYTHKPPLFLWLEATLRLAGLSWTAAGVVPSLLALLGIMALLPRLARASGLEEDTGRLAAVALAASPLAAFLGLGARMDMLLALSFTLSLLALAHLLGLGPSTVSRRRAHLGFWAAIGLGVLVKGPVAVVLPVLAALAAWALLRPRPSLRAVFAGWGPVLCLGLVFTWLVPAAIAGGPDYLYDIVVRQSAGRMANSFAHREPFHFYLLRYPLLGLPWSVAVVVATARTLRRRALDGGAFLALATVTVLVFFSLLSGKLEIYLLPLFPPALLLTANAWRDREPGQRTALALGACGMALVGVAAALLPRFGAGGSIPTAAWVVVGAAIALPATAAVIRAMRGAPIAATVSLVAVSGLAVPAVLLPAGIHALNSTQSAAAAAAAVRLAEPGADEHLRFGADYAGLWLYAERPFRELPDSAAVEAELGRGRCVLIEEKRWTALPDALKTRVDRIERIPLRRRTLHLACGLRPSD